MTLVVLAACLLMIAAAWIPSYWWAFGLQDSRQRYEWFVVQGILFVNTFAPNYVATKIAPVLGWTPGFHLKRAALFDPSFPLLRRRAGPSHWRLVLPLHLPFLVFATPLAVLYVYPRLPNPRHRWRRKHGLCVSCGYDLTGNVSGVCPECGQGV